MGKQNEKSAEKQTQKKWLALATYAIALLCLLAGLLIPLGNSTGSIKDGFKLENMLLWQLPAAFKGLTGVDLKFGAETFTYSFPIDLFGLLKDGKTFDLGAVFCLLYLLVTVAALIGLIPVIASNRNKQTALKTASVIEVLAGFVLTVLMLMRLYVYVGTADVEGDAMNFSYALLIAFGGTVLMLIIQSMGYKKGSGVIKTLLLLLSGVTLFFLMYPLTGYSTKFATWLDGKLATGLYGVGGEGIGFLTLLFCGFAGYKAAFNGAAAAADKTILIVTTIIAFLAIINFLLDLAGLGKKTKRFMLVSNLIRYSLQLAAVIALVVTVAITDGYKLEILMYVLIGVTVLELLINVIRFCTYKKGKKPVKNTTASANANASEATAEKVDKKAEKRAAKEARKAEKAARKTETNGAPVEAQTAYATAVEEEQPAVYEVKAIYDGPVDDFIKKLTTAERIEFANAFIEHNLILPNVPDYIVGGKNEKFFASVFIYYARIRDRISDGLLNKIYEQGNLMH